ncbi:hypothetical protein GCM10008957_30480 [Deinococcus ruber]|uniref:HTH araC/xylS-type domain-containing protein n=2 Tax=Deinococcus ruber TaxID=1848197 RepID=A0A918CBB0_9DEIO|nr:hypothetical protein GCM10008957_30480 [Deinococcus ruber]
MLEDLTGRSERWLERQCRAQLGCTFQSLQRLLRIERTLLTLHAHPQPDFATIAYALGFADQAHLSREVRRFTGCTPTHLWQQLHTLPENFKTPSTASAKLMP